MLLRPLRDPYCERGTSYCRVQGRPRGGSLNNGNERKPFRRRIVLIRVLPLSSPLEHDVDDAWLKSAAPHADSKGKSGQFEPPSNFALQLFAAYSVLPTESPVLRKARGCLSWKTREPRICLSSAQHPLIPSLTIFGASVTFSLPLLQGTRARKQRATKQAYSIVKAFALPNHFGTVKSRELRVACNVPGAGRTAAVRHTDKSNCNCAARIVWRRMLAEDFLSVQSVL